MKLVDGFTIEEVKILLIAMNYPFDRDREFKKAWKRIIPNITLYEKNYIIVNVKRLIREYEKDLQSTDGVYDRVKHSKILAWNIYINDIITKCWRCYRKLIKLYEQNYGDKYIPINK